MLIDVMMVSTTCWQGVKPHMLEILKLGSTTMVGALMLKGMGKNSYAQLIKGTGILYCGCQVIMMILSMHENPPMIIKVLRTIFTPVVKLITG